MARSTPTSLAPTDGRTGASPDPRLDASAPELQRFGTLRSLPIGAARQGQTESCRLLNEILADSMVLYALYKKHHWLVAGPTFYQLHLLFDKHAEEQNEIIDAPRRAGPEPGRHRRRRPAPRGRADHDPAAARWRRGGRGHDRPHAARPRDGHRRRSARRSRRPRSRKDWGTNDLLMSDVLRRHELQVWFLAEHVVDVPLTSRLTGAVILRPGQRREPPAAEPIAAPAAAPTARPTFRA